MNEREEIYNLDNSSKKLSWQQWEIKDVFEANSYVKNKINPLEKKEI